MSNKRNQPFVSKVGVDLTSAIEMDESLNSKITEIYKRNAAMGLAPMYNKDIFKAEFLNEALFLSDLRRTSLGNSLDFVDMQMNKTLVIISAKEGSLLSSAKFLPMVDTKLQNMFSKHSLLDKSPLEKLMYSEEIEHHGYSLEALKIISSSYQLNMNNFYSKTFEASDLFNQLYSLNGNFIVLFDMQLKLFKQSNMIDEGLRGLPDNWNFTGGLYQAGWSTKVYLQDLFVN